MRREPEVPEARVPVVECLDGPARIASKELAPILSVKNGILQNACSTSRRMDADLEKKCSFAHRQVEEQPSKRSKKNGDKSAVAMLKKNEHHRRTGRPVMNAYSPNTRQLGCIFQDMEPPKSLSILRKSSDIRKPIRCVKFTKAVVLTVETKILRSERFAQVNLISVTPMLQNLRFGLRKRQNGKSDVLVKQRGGWLKSILKIKEQERATFFSPSENRCLPASNLKPEEREFVVDSGASVHMISRKDLNSAEMDTFTKSCSPTTVITAYGEVQTHEEATVYVKELDIFLTM